MTSYTAYIHQKLFLRNHRRGGLAGYIDDNCFVQRPDYVADFVSPYSLLTDLNLVDVQIPQRKDTSQEIPARTLSALSRLVLFNTLCS